MTDGLVFRTIGDIFREEVEEEERLRASGELRPVSDRVAQDRHGHDVTLRWQPRSRCIQFLEAGHWFYEVDVERMRDSASVLDWIAQVAMKTWSTPAIVGSLVEMLDELLELQAHVCTGGVDRSFEPLELLARRLLISTPQESDDR